jgi:hypothetical protein
MGKSTESHFYDSPTTAKATFDHVHLGKLNTLLSSLQASHQRKMYEMCGVNMQSQSAYELAIKGPIRPAVSNIPLIYSIRCIEFKRPFFTIGKIIMPFTLSLLNCLLSNCELEKLVAFKEIKILTVSKELNLNVE